MIPAYLARRFDLPRGRWLRDVLLVYLAADRFDDNSFSTVVTKDIRENLEPEEIALLVRDSAYESVIGSFATSPVLSQLHKLRLKGRVPITILSFGPDGAEKRRAVYPAEGAASDLGIAELGRRTITAIFNDRRGFVESTPAYHFENPSGKHTERFIRLSNILHSSAEISLLALFALPFIPDDIATIYVDTPALFSLTSAVNDHLKSLSPGRPTLFVESFGSYQGLRDFRFDDLLESVVIVSASSSGSLGDLLVSDHGFERRQVIHFLYLGPEQDNLRVVADLSFDGKDNPHGYKDRPSKQHEEVCSLCASGSIAIPLRGDQFEPAGPQTEPIYLVKNDAPEGLRKLVGQMGGQCIFGVGMGSKNVGQPRLFNVAPDKLIESSRFAEDLEYVIRGSIPVGLEYVIYLDPGSQPIANAVANRSEQFASRPAVISRDELDKIPQGTTTPVVLVAAVIESGRSLLDLSRDLRTITPNAPLVYLVGFNKTTGEDQRESLTKNLSQALAAVQHEVIFVERMVLPSSNEDHAWSREIDVLKELVQGEGVSDEEKALLVRRLERLTDRNEVLCEDVFLPTPLAGELSIRPGFVFAAPDGKCEHFKQSDVFFIISSVLQRLRANSEKPGARALRSNWFQQTVLAPDTFSRFNDGIIQASFLRAATPSELNYLDREDLSREVARVVRRIILGGASARGEAALEFLLAMATHRLSLRKSHVSELLTVPAGLPALEVAFLEACKRGLL